MDLNEEQKAVIRECKILGSGSMCVPLGFGKTYTSLALAIHLRKKIEDKPPILIVVPKTLLEQWMSEIKKFYGERSENFVAILHNEYVKYDDFEVKNRTAIVLTTPETVLKAYKVFNIEDMFISQRDAFAQIEYDTSNKPYFKEKTGLGIFFSIKWSCIVIDEADSCLNVTTKRCKSLASLSAYHRWLLSGTLISEPKKQILYGYYLITRDEGFMESNDRNFYVATNALKKSMVIRTENKYFIKPELKINIVTHEISEIEKKFYKLYKGIYSDFFIRYEFLKSLTGREVSLDVRSEITFLRGTLLALITYVRQSIIFGIVPFTSSLLSLSEKENQYESYKSIIQRHIESSGLKEDMKTLDDIESTRCKEIIKILQKYKHEKTIIYSAFAKVMKLYKHFIEKAMGKSFVFEIDSSMKSKKRQEIIEEFREAECGVLLSTYDVSSKGLNLQFCSNVIISDLWWNSGKEEQALGRVYRMGQTNPVVRIFFMNTNTKIENIVLAKQKSKKNIVKDIIEGNKVVDKIPKANLKDLYTHLQHEYPETSIIYEDVYGQ